jgi:hypothetical protein
MLGKLEAPTSRERTDIAHMDLLLPDWRSSSLMIIPAMLGGQRWGSGAVDAFATGAWCSCSAGDLAESRREGWRGVSGKIPVTPDGIFSIVSWYVVNMLRDLACFVSCRDMLGFQGSDVNERVPQVMSAWGLE